MQKIHPCLWFDHQAEEAMHYYTSIFKNSKMGEVTYYGPNMPLPEGTVLTALFELEGEQFMLLNGGPEFSHSEAVSFFVHCQSQEEVDDLWDKLTAEGEESMCGWLKDKYGVSWQIIPDQLGELMTDPDAAKAGRVIAAMMQMRKIDIRVLEQARDGVMEG